MMNTVMIEGNDKSDYITGGNCTVHHVIEKILIIKHKMWELCSYSVHQLYKKFSDVYYQIDVWKFRGEIINISMKRAKKL